jgi:hypothetical protein
VRGDEDGRQLIRVAREAAVEDRSPTCQASATSSRMQSAVFMPNDPGTHGPTGRSRRDSRRRPAGAQTAPHGGIVVDYADRRALDPRRWS